MGSDMRNLWTTLLIVLLGAAPGWAVLGEYASSIDLDQQILRGERRELVRQGYKVHELTFVERLGGERIRFPGGLGFRRYLAGAADAESAASSWGIIIWQSYSRRSPRGRASHSGAPLIVRTAKLVFVSGGHMRSFHGYAYVPSLVPANVSAGGDA